MLGLTHPEIRAEVYDLDLSSLLAGIQYSCWWYSWGIGQGRSCWAKHRHSQAWGSREPSKLILPVYLVCYFVFWCVQIFIIVPVVFTRFFNFSRVYDHAILDQGQGLSIRCTAAAYIAEARLSSENTHFFAAMYSRVSSHTWETLSGVTAIPRGSSCYNLRKPPRTTLP